MDDSARIAQNPLVRAILGCAAAVIIAAFLPWAKVSATGFNFSVSVKGTSGDGKLTIVLAIIGLVLLFASAGKRGTLIGHTVAAALIAVIAILDVVDVKDTAGGLVGASVGIGLWITLIAAIAWTALAVYVLRKLTAQPSAVSETQPPVV